MGARGSCRYTDLHRIVTAGMEGRHKQQFTYCALANNYASLMCSFGVEIHVEKETIESSIFMLKNMNTLKKTLCILSH
jgi:hypothetical protein